MDKDKHTKSTVEITSEALSKLIKENNYTPEQFQTVYISQMVILLAALDDDMKELIKTLKDRSSANERTAYWKYNPDTDLAECSNCGASCPHDKLGRILTNYCPRCGAEMEGTS